MRRHNVSVITSQLTPKAFSVVLVFKFQIEIVVSMIRYTYPETEQKVPCSATFSTGSRPVSISLINSLTNFRPSSTLFTDFTAVANVKNVSYPVVDAGEGSLGKLSHPWASKGGQWEGFSSPGF